MHFSGRFLSDVKFKDCVADLIEDASAGGVYDLSIHRHLMMRERFRLSGVEIHQMDLPVPGVAGGYLLLFDTGEVDPLAALINHAIPDERIIVEIETEVAAAIAIREPDDVMSGSAVDPFGGHGLSVC